MNEESKFTFSANGLTFGPYDTFESAALAGAAYAKRCFELGGKTIPMWPAITVSELRPPAH